MAALPSNTYTTLQQIDAKVEANANQENRPHLGGSLIGRECRRHLWYAFRWAFKPNFSGRMLRLFQRGQNEEAVLVKLLRDVGVTVWEADQGGAQYHVSFLGGHLSGSVDGVAKGLVEAPKTPHLLEFKTHNDKYFKQLIKHGVQKAKPEHYAQMQLYMNGLKLKRAMYMAVNKNDDSLYTERLKYDAAFAKLLIEKAKTIIESPVPLEKIGDEDYFKCRFCDAKELCHGEKVADVNCRTCLHSTPKLDGYQKWFCELHKLDIPAKAQSKGCKHHLFIPQLVSYAKQIDADEKSNTVTYEYQDVQFKNGENGELSFTSKELSAMSASLLVDEQFQSLRNQFDGEVVKGAA